MRLGIFAAEQGAYPRAVELLERSVVTFTELGGQTYAAISRGNLGVLRLVMGEHEEAMRLLESATEDLVRAGTLEHAEGHRDMAVQLVAFADARHEELAIEPTAREQALYGPLLPAARADASDPAFAAARERGRGMSFEEAANLALGGWPALPIVEARTTGSRRG